jgi:hypothetical protein
LLLTCNGRSAEISDGARLKLKPIPPCTSLLAAARANHISLSSFDPLSGTNALRPGDSATVLVTFVQKEKRTQWLLYIETTEPDPKKKPQKWPDFVVTSSFGPPMKFPSKAVPAKLRLFGPFADSAKPPRADEKDAQFSVNEGFLRLGLDQAAALLWRFSRFTNSSGPVTSKALLAMKPTPAEQRAICGSFPALFSYVDIVQHTEGLEGLFFKLVELPSLWSMIRHGGVDPNISFGNRDLPSTADAADWNLPPATPVYYFPFLVRLNNQPALRVTLVVTSPQTPLLICGGVVGLLAEKIDDDRMYMSLRLVSAHSAANAPRK